MSTVRTIGNTPNASTDKIPENLQLSGIISKIFAEVLNTPPADSKKNEENKDLPTLTPPTGGLSLDSLLQAIGHTARREACRAGVDSMTQKGTEQKHINAKQLEELKKQLEAMEKKNTLNIFAKIFQWIGLLVGVIASVATITAGSMTGNPLLLVAGLAALTMTVDSGLSMATDGKVCIAAGLTAIAKAFGMNEKDAQTFTFVMQMVIAAAMVALSFGAAFANTANTATTIADGVKKLINLQQVANLTSAVVTTGQGGIAIGSALLDYKVEKGKVTNKELDALLERLRQAIDMEKDLLEAELKRSTSLLEKVSDIVKNNNETQMAIMTTTPRLA